MDVFAMGFSFCLHTIPRQDLLHAFAIDATVVPVKQVTRILSKMEGMDTEMARGYVPSTLKDLVEDLEPFPTGNPSDVLADTKGMFPCMVAMMGSGTGFTKVSYRIFLPNTHEGPCRHCDPSKCDKVVLIHKHSGTCSPYQLLVNNQDTW